MKQVLTKDILIQDVKRKFPDTSSALKFLLLVYIFIGLPIIGYMNLEAMIVAIFLLCVILLVRLSTSSKSKKTPEIFAKEVKRNQYTVYLAKCNSKKVLGKSEFLNLSEEEATSQMHTQDDPFFQNYMLYFDDGRQYLCSKEEYEKVSYGEKFYCVETDSRWRSDFYSVDFWELDDTLKVFLRKYGKE